MDFELLNKILKNHTLKLCGDNLVTSSPTRFRLVAFLPVTTTLAPRLENSLTVASPIPEVEPVTKTTFPVKFLEFLTSS